MKCSPVSSNDNYRNAAIDDVDDKTFWDEWSRMAMVVTMSSGDSDQ